MINFNHIVNRVDATIKRCGSDLSGLEQELRHLADRFGNEALISALAQCAVIAYLRLNSNQPSDQRSFLTGLN